MNSKETMSHENMISQWCHYENKNIVKSPDWQDINYMDLILIPKTFEDFFLKGL